MAGIWITVWQAITTFLQAFGHASYHFLQGILRCLLVTAQRAAAFITTVWQGITNWMRAAWNAITRWCREMVSVWYQNLPQSVKEHLPRKLASWFKLIIKIITAVILQTSDVGTDYYSGYKHWM